MSSRCLRNTLFFGLIWHLVLFGSARIFRLTGKKSARCSWRANPVLSEVLRAGRESTAGLSPLSTPDSILMCYQKLSRGRAEERPELCYDKRHVWAVTATVTLLDSLGNFIFLCLICKQLPRLWVPSTGLPIHTLLGRPQDGWSVLCLQQFSEYQGQWRA